MNFSKFTIVVISLFIITFILSFSITRYWVRESYRDITLNIELSVRTKDKKDIKIISNVNYDNIDRRSQYYIKKAITESCSYMFHLYTYEEIQNNKAEIEALTTEDIFNRIQEKGFIIHQFTYEIKED